MEEVRKKLIEAFGRQSAFWGLGRTTGEIYAVLYLDGEPLSLEEIALRLGVTKGNISLAMRNLEHLGLARRVWQRGDRRLFFQAEIDLWKVVHSVLARRHQTEFADTFTLVEAAWEDAKHISGPAKEQLMERLQELRTFYTVVDALVKALLVSPPEETAEMAQMAAVLLAKRGGN